MFRKYNPLDFAEIAPVVELVRILKPALADILSIIHIRDKDIIDPAIDLLPCLLHGRAGAADDQSDSCCAGNKPVPIVALDILYMDSFDIGLPEDDDCIF
jgi:hypothetical protein